MRTRASVVGVLVAGLLGGIWSACSSESGGSGGNGATAAAGGGTGAGGELDQQIINPIN